MAKRKDLHLIVGLSAEVHPEGPKKRNQYIQHGRGSLSRQHDEVQYFQTGPDFQEPQLSYGLPGRLMLMTASWLSNRATYSLDAYCTPRSEWTSPVQVVVELARYSRPRQPIRFPDYDRCSNPRVVSDAHDRMILGIRTHKIARSAKSFTKQQLLPRMKSVPTTAETAQITIRHRQDQIGTIGAFGSSRCRSSGSLVTMVS
jgi:hypothetical protein